MKNFRNLIIVLSALFLASCAGKQADESPVQQIRAYQKQISDINEKIATLDSTKAASKIDKSDLTLIKTIPVAETAFNHTITASGAVEAIKFAGLSAEMSGKIMNINVTEGQVVTKGTLLVKLDDRMLQSQLNQANIALELATTMFNKQKELWDKNIGTEVQFLQAKNQKESLENQIQTLNVQISMTKIIAPFDGVVDRIYQKEGELANPAIKLIDFVNLSQLYVNADVSEDYISTIKEGDKAVIVFPSFNNLKINTTVYRTTNIVNPNSRSFLTRIKISNVNNQIKPNIIANVILSDYVNKNALTVPSYLIQSDLDGQYLYLADALKNAYQVRKQYVKVGLSENGITEILEGLKAGDLLISAGYNQVRKGETVAIAE
jgi:RND family efflux transporter MFP subunit